ncbi:MAG TPA: Na/Pi cotransporter family protein [Gammaproteobacteria bacterium]|nr:Na/Pi cotransporter family protein [Gammaproteobacteria bacterium]
MPEMHSRSQLARAWRQTGMLLLAAAILLAAAPSWAADEAALEMHWGGMAMNLLGGLALFLFGMEQMADALKAVAGERMKIVLARLTTNRFMGALTGAFVTAIIQSSSVTMVLVVGFISAGLMSMAQSIGVIMGANIGTTITAQIVAFKVTKAALLMVAAGFAMLFFSSNEKIKHYGGMLMGLGLIFFGMSVMSDAMYPLRAYQPFLDLMTQMANPLIGILVAALFTALVQSSSATTGIVIVMASQGFITLPAGIALAFGANIGTCVTALLASIGKPREAIRAAVVHVLFNVFGVLAWIGLIGWLAQFVTAFSPVHPELSGTARLAAETPRQIANAHTFFNIANTLLFIGFTGQLARLVEWLVPDKPLVEGAVAEPRYLDDSLFETPSLALDRVRLEIGHIGDRVREMLDLIMPAILGGDRSALRDVARIDDDVDVLHGHVVTYLGKISRKELTEDQTHQFVNLMAAANDLENIGDVVETDLVHLGNQRISEGVSISPSTRQVLTEVHKAVTAATDLAIRAVAENNADAAREVIGMKEAISEMAQSAAMHQIKRLVAEEPNRLAAYTIEMDIIEKLKRTYYFAKRMAKTLDVDAEEHAEEAEAAA